MVSTAGTDPQQYLLNGTLDLCALRYEDNMQQFTGVYCNWAWDHYLCWPPTPAGASVQQKCPAGNGLDTSKFVERKCTTDGFWDIKPGATRIQYPNGWTNFSSCYSPEMAQLMKKLYAGGDDDSAKMKFDIAERTRILEMIGLSISLLTLLISLVIFCNFRSLRNNRTKIHKNLFIAMVNQVVIRMTLYLDQAIVNNQQTFGNESTHHGIKNTPYICEGTYIMLEYARTAMFMWMFIEGLYLHNVITVTVFQGRFPHTLYAILGWGVPAIMTVIWAAFTAKYKQGQQCWWGYNFTSLYWILEGPRLAVLLLNFIFLLNIIRVLMVKLRQSQTSDVEQVRKAVRAAIVLLPLLGITNILNMTEAPLHRSAFEFALWSYTTHFLTSFQGFFIAVIYCFRNNEVRAVLVKSITVYMSLRGHMDWMPQRHSAAYATAPDTEPDHIHPRHRQRRLSKRHWIAPYFQRRKILREKDINAPQAPETNV